MQRAGGYWATLPDESVDERKARWARIDEREQALNVLLEDIHKGATLNENTRATTKGFLDAFVGIMFKDIPEDQQEYVLERFAAFDSTLVMKKLEEGVKK